MSELTPAHLEIDAHGTPYAPDFADIYYSRQDGLAESRYVFLQGNQLPERWQRQPFFTIAETGFGTGLNFLATWQAWLADEKRCQRLHFISIEKHPLSKKQLAALAVDRPELQPLLEELLEAYPPLIAGFHRLHLAQGRIQLTLCFMDVLQALPELVATVDAWYLDGFAPARNAAMWQLEVMQAIARLSHTQTTLATFTSASEVRRNLQAAGFDVAKRAGFGKKREMLTARYTQVATNKWVKPWFALPKPYTPQTVQVIGGGIAGCQIARALAERGWQVILLERNARLAQEASGNRAGIVAPKMTAKLGWGEYFYRQAFLYAIQQLKHLSKAGHAIEWQACGSLQLAHEPREAARQLSIQQRGLDPEFIQILNATDASSVAGMPLAYGASYFPQGAWVNPASLCYVLIDHPAIEVQTQTTLSHLTPDTLTVLATGQALDEWLDKTHFPLIPVLGQTSQGAGSTCGQTIKTTIGHEGYVTPAVQGYHVFGATFERGQRESVLKASADQTNQQQLAHYLPDLAASFSTVVSGHAAIRMSTLDRYPVVGALPDSHFYTQSYADLRHGNKYQTFALAKYQPNIMISGGYGSRGLSTSGLCAELLACLITGEPLPVQATLYESLHPARFLIRQLIKA